MWRRSADLPVILSHETKTGIIIFPNRKMGGRDMVIVWLNKEVKSGESFDLDDIGKVKALLHFSDPRAMRITAEALLKACEKWEKETKSNER